MIYFIQYTVDKWEVYVLISKSNLRLNMTVSAASNGQRKKAYTCTKIVYKITSVLICVRLIHTCHQSVEIYDRKM